MKDAQKTAVAIPEVEVVDERAFTTESVVGPYGITAEIPDMHHVVEWQEFRAIPFQGYYRLILPPVVKALQAGIKQRYGTKAVIMYSSPEMALKELLEYLWIEEGHRTIEVEPANASLSERISSLPYDLVAVGAGDITLSSSCDPAPRAGTRSVLMLDCLPEDAKRLSAYDYVVAGVTPVDSPVTAGVCLTNHWDEAKVIHERNRRRGACIAARDGAWLMNRDADLNPSPDCRTQVAKKLCAFESAAHATLYPSGMCAVTVAMDVLRLQTGTSHFVVVGHPYSDTHLLCKHLPWAGTEMTSVMLAGSDLDGLSDALAAQPTTAVLVESITNPLNEVPDLEAITTICRAQGVAVVVDATMASPFNSQPLNLGADLVVHSTAKYLSGNNNHGGGVVLTNDADLYEALADYRSRWVLDMSPLEAAVLNESLADFESRMLLFNRNGLQLAEWLQKHPAVGQVYFAMLPDNPDHEVARRLLKGGGSVVSFSLKDPSFEAVKRFYDTSMPLIKKAPSLGSNITLMCPYTLLTYYQKDDAYLDAHRLDRYLLRISVGCEDPLDPVLENLGRALVAAQGGSA